MIHARQIETREAALEAAIDKLQSGYVSLIIEDDGEGTWTVWDSSAEIFPDYPSWTYDEGVDFSEGDGEEISRMFEKHESLETVKHFMYHFSALREWIDGAEDFQSIVLEWSPVTDASLEYSDEIDAYLDEDGDIVYDNLAGHVYGVRTYSYDD